MEFRITDVIQIFRLTSVLLKPGIDQPDEVHRINHKMDHLQSSTNIGPNDFVFCRSAEDSRPHDPDDLRREVLYPVLDRCGIKRTPRADGFHAFRRATSKYLRKASGLELAAVQLGHKRMTTTDEHYNDRDMDDLKKAAELVESAFILSFAPDC
jgi:hypothetical protein